MRHRADLVPPVVDVFPFAYGPQVLLIRMRELADVVREHVIVEADRTFSGLPRDPLWPTLAERPEFQPFVHKVRWVFREMPELSTEWGRDEWARDVALQAVLTMSHYHPDELILFSDHDEVPHPLAVRRRGALLRTGDVARLWVRYHEWKMNLRAAGSPLHRWEYRQPVLTRRDTLPLGQLGSLLRAAPGAVNDRPLPGEPMGWHLTLQGTPIEILAKLRSYAHTELAGLTLAQVELMIEEQRDILDRCALERVPDADLPTCVRDDRRAWEGWLV